MSIETLVAVRLISDRDVLCRADWISPELRIRLRPLRGFRQSYAWTIFGGDRPIYALEIRFAMPGVLINAAVKKLA